MVRTACVVLASTLEVSLALYNAFYVDLALGVIGLAALVLSCAPLAHAASRRLGGFHLPATTEVAEWTEPDDQYPDADG